MQARRKSHKPKQPVAVTVVAFAIVVLFLIRLYQVYEPLLREKVFINGMTGSLRIGWQLTSLGNAVLTSTTYLVLSIAGIIVLIGFLRLRRWSWLLLMTWTSASLIISLVEYFYGHPNYAVIASNVIIAFALNLSDVQRIFAARRDNGTLP